MLRVLTALALLAAVPTAALADRKDADHCAKGLSGDTLKTYRAGVVLVERGQTLENAMRAYLEPKYNRGEITEAEGRKMGRDAANCMRLVHKK
jgi:hypothetical protein